MPTVTIVTPSLNQSHFIEDAIASVASQDYPEIEHIIADGGSVDGTLEILKRNNRLVWFSEPDRGQSDALNKGFSRSSGEIIGWLNADDTYEPNAVHAAVEFFRAHPNVAMVYGFVNIMDESGDVMRTRYSPDFDLGLFIRGGHCYIQPVTFFRRKVFEEVGNLDIAFHEAMDYEFFIRVGQKFKIKRIPRILGNFRTHSRSKTFSGQISERGLRERNEILTRYASLSASDYPNTVTFLRDYAIMMFYKYYGGLRSLPKLMSYRFKHL